MKLSTPKGEKKRRCRRWAEHGWVRRSNPPKAQGNTVPERRNRRCPAVRCIPWGWRSSLPGAPAPAGWPAPPFSHQWGSDDGTIVLQRLTVISARDRVGSCRSSSATVSSATRRLVVSSTEEARTSCSAWLIMSAARYRGLAVSSATMRISLGPAIMSMSTTRTAAVWQLPHRYCRGHDLVYTGDGLGAVGH